jgi:hypothetical protein
MIAFTEVDWEFLTGLKQLLSLVNGHSNQRGASFVCSYIHMYTWNHPCPFFVSSIPLPLLKAALASNFRILLYADAPVSRTTAFLSAQYVALWQIGSTKWQEILDFPSTVEPILVVPPQSSRTRLCWLEGGVHNSLPNPPA